MGISELHVFFRGIFAFFITEICVLLCIVFVSTWGMGAVYDKMYQYIVNSKAALLESDINVDAGLNDQLDVNRVLYIAGSSGVFGFDGELFEQLTGKKTYNLSTHAGFGIEYTMSMYKKYIKRNDIVIIAFEPTLFYTNEINSASLMTGIDDRLLLYRHVKPTDYLEIIKYFPTYLFKKIDHLYNERAQDVGIYSSEAFDERMELRFPRNNTTSEYKNIKNDKIDNDSITQCQILTDKIKYINDYYEYCNDIGAQMIFTYAPMEKTSNSFYYEYEKYISNVINCPIISCVEDNIYPRSCMYDTEFHLLSEGQMERTFRLAECLADYLKDENIHESINQFKSPEMEVGFTTEFNPKWYISDGFCESESTGTWTNDVFATISFPYICNDNLKLSIEGWPCSKSYITEIYVNDIFIGYWDNELTINSFVIPNAVLNSIWQTITIKTINIDSPYNMALGNDTRKLGLHIQKLYVEYENKENLY